MAASAAAPARRKALGQRPGAIMGGMSWQMPAWYADAGCQDADPAAFFEPGREDEATQVCAGCPVRQQCLELALAMTPAHDWGVMGGTTRDERRQMRGMRQRPAVA